MCSHQTTWFCRHGMLMRIRLRRSGTSWVRASGRATHQYWERSARAVATAHGIAASHGLDATHRTARAHVTTDARGSAGAHGIVAPCSNPLVCVAGRFGAHLVRTTSWRFIRKPSICRCQSSGLVGYRENMFLDHHLLQGFNGHQVHWVRGNIRFRLSSGRSGAVMRASAGPGCGRT